MPVQAPNTEAQRHMRIPDDLWKPFLALCQVRYSTGADEVRTLIRLHLAEYGVFWAEKSSDNPEKIAWFECEECNDVHPLLESEGRPWGCDVEKSKRERMVNSARAAREIVAPRMERGS